MKISYVNLNTAEMRFDAGEPIQAHVLRAGVQHAADRGNVYNVDVIIEPALAFDHADVLREYGFAPAGNLQEGTPVSNTMLRYRKMIRRSGDGNPTGQTLDSNLAVPQPMLGATNEELAAIELMRQRSAALSAERLDALAKMGKQPTPEEPDDPIIAKMRAELKEMERALEEM